MAGIIAVMQAEGYPGKLPKRDLSGPFGTALLKLASYSQPRGIGSYLRSHLGRVPRYDAGKSVRELGMHYRPAIESVKDTLADLVRWGHVAPPQHR